ncbi:MAG: Predicted riboflavin ABC transporter, substrate-binding component [uncultured Thermomicrobiales bacterium]|uniref:Predicted riboflavin ABC transporter, substrate-binding component n=1 Tax=uncultured Thermomicrobiales bacterium TaxID=1645740 RepID=A0A6J4VCI3_9BACT|nr:MAG: Predicted riboflavin ABC transporter, substrate-binding component [uncultured Thermomicrobiales bacterium]
MRRVMNLALGVLLLLTLAGCGAAATPTAGVSSAPTAGAGGGVAATPSRSGGALRKVTIGLGYIPDVQFAPFYVAKERGYFREEGLEVEFKQGFETDVLKLLGTGALNFGVAGGDEMMIARSQGVPLVYVGTWFQKYPITVVALEGANIRRAEDLKGRTIGIPGRYGATYIGLRALLDSAGLKESDVQLREVGFNQVQALTQGQVEAVVGYANNEPVQLRALGKAITTINVFDRVSLVSNGLITDEKTQRDDPELVRAVTRAILRGIRDTLANPDEAVTLSMPTIPGAAEKREQLRAVLAATLPLLESAQTGTNGLGYCDPASWATSRDLLKRLGFLGGDFDLDKAYTNAFLPKR